MTEAASPLAYIRSCREARGLSVDDVALGVETVPHVSAMTRAEWVAAIEEGTAPLSIGAALAMQRVVQFDWDVLVALAAIEAGLDQIPIAKAAA